MSLRPSKLRLFPAGLATSWTALTLDRRRHIKLALLGAALSWTLAGLLACAGPRQGPKQPLFELLGGVQAIEAVSARTLDRVAADPRTKRTFEGVKMAALKQSVSAYICRVADGPCVYEGEAMARSHADLNIAGSEFDVMVSVLREELNRSGVSEYAKNELLRRLAPTRRDIVQH